MPGQFSFSSSGNKLAKGGGRRREKNRSSSRTFTKQRHEPSPRHHGCFLKIGEFFSCDFPLFSFSFFSGIESLCGLRFSCSQGKEEDSDEERRKEQFFPPLSRSLPSPFYRRKMLKILFLLLPTPPDSRLRRKAAFCGGGGEKTLAGATEYIPGKKNMPAV